VLVEPIHAMDEEGGPVGHRAVLAGAVEHAVLPEQGTGQARAATVGDHRVLRMRAPFAVERIAVEREELLVRRAAGLAHAREEPEPAPVIEQRGIPGLDAAEQHLLERPAEGELQRAVRPDRSMGRGLPQHVPDAVALEHERITRTPRPDRRSSVGQYQSNESEMRGVRSPTR
jgi:hypothetical protein